MTPRKPPTLRQRRLAAELLRLRTAAGMSREQVAEKTDINVATLYRLETAKGSPQRRTLNTLMNTYNVSDDQRPDLVDLLRTSGEENWLQPYFSSIPEEYGMYIQLESEAQFVRNYESLLIPGLLQTSAYTQASTQGENPTWASEQIDFQAKIRANRQALLTRANPLALWAIVDEAALRRAVGGAAVMHEQYRHLLTMTELPHVTFQVVPFSAGAHAGMLGSFSIFDFPGPAATVACVETMSGTLFRETEADVARCTLKYDHLRATALSPAESSHLLESLVRS